MTLSAMDRSLSPDPLGHAVELPYHARLYPIGFPLEIATNSEDVLLAANQSWSDFPAAFEQKAAVQLRVVVGDAEGGGLPAPPRYQAQGHLLAVVSDAANFAVCDFETGFLFCRLTSETAAATAWVRHFFLDPIVYTALDHLYVTAVHAACVARDGRGVMLSGCSGAGKSALSLACSQNGWTFITDDVAYLVNGEPGRRVLGKPAWIRFKPSAAELFPALKDRKPAIDSVGQTIVECRTGELGMVSTAHSCQVNHLVFLNRSASGRGGCIPVSRRDALHRLLRELPLYNRKVYETHANTLNRLIEAGAYELRYSSLEEGVRLLDQLTARG